MALRVLTFLNFIFALSLFFYTFYKSEIVLNGELRNYYNIYYITSILLIIFSIILFFIKKQLKIYIFIILISIIFSSYLFESFLIFSEDPFESKLKNNRAEIYEKNSKLKFDRRKTFKIYSDLLKENKNIVVSMHSYYHPKSTLYSLSGISNSKTIYCNENGYFAIYESDRYGFNNPDTEWDSNEIEYLFIGDSFTHGACVNRPNDIPSVLRALSNKKVLNLGLRGNGPLREYATLKEYLPNNTKKIIWMYFETNDLEGLHQEKKDNFLMNYLKDKDFKQNLISRQSEIDEKLKTILKKRVSKKSKFFSFVKLYQLRSYIYKFLYLEDRNKFSNLERNKILSDFKLIINSAKDFAKKNESELYFVYLPGYERYSNPTYDEKNYYEIKKIISSLNIEFIDIHEEVFAKEKNPLENFPFQLFGHYNVTGYNKVSKAIYRLSSSYK